MRWIRKYGIGALLSALFIALKLAPLRTMPRIFADTRQGYFPAAAAPIWSRGFLAGARPFVVPLLYKMVGLRPHSIVITQTLISIVAWLILALTLASIVRGDRVRALCLAAIYGFALGLNVTMWDYCLLSESLSLSLFALLCAAWLALSLRFRFPTLITVMILSFLWSFTRESNGYEILAAGLLLLALAAFRRIRAGYLALALASFATFAALQYSSDIGQRWLAPSLNVFDKRILVSPQFIDFFISHGMPDSPALRALAGIPPSTDHNAAYRDPRLEGFRQWWIFHGKPTYARFLITHPRFLLLAPFADLRSEYLPDLEFYDSPPLVRTWRTIVDSVFNPRMPAAFFPWISLVALGLFASRRDQWEPRHAVPVVLCALVVPLCLFVWHCDTTEIDRHSLQNAMQLRLGLWMLLLFALDRRSTTR